MIHLSNWGQHRISASAAAPRVRVTCQYGCLSCHSPPGPSREPLGFNPGAPPFKGVGGKLANIIPIPWEVTFTHGDVHSSTLSPGLIPRRLSSWFRPSALNRLLPSLEQSRNKEEMNKLNNSVNNRGLRLIFQHYLQISPEKPADSLIFEHKCSPDPFQTREGKYEAAKRGNRSVCEGV